MTRSGGAMTLSPLNGGTRPGPHHESGVIGRTKPVTEENAVLHSPAVTLLRPARALPRLHLWPPLALVLAGACLVSQPVLAAPVTKTFIASGTSISCEGLICRESLFSGKIDYLDPDDSVHNSLGLGALSLFSFDAGFGRRPLLMPYVAPRDEVRPSLGFREVGDSIEVDLIAYSEFDPLPGAMDTGVRWRVSSDGSFDRNDGHGEVIFSRLGAVQWHRAPEPGTLLLVAAAALALVRSSWRRAQAR